MWTLTAAATAALLGVAAAPVSAADHHRVQAFVTAGLPPLRTKALEATIAGLPDSKVSGALVQVRGVDGDFSGTGGIAEVGTDRPVPQQGQFRIGSMTKAFTAAVALQLVHEGALELDRPVRDYLPDVVPADFPTITVRQVLTYTSGLTGVNVPHKTPAWFLAHRYDHWAPGSQIDWTTRPSFEPGTRQRYGNVDYWVAGLLIERVTGHTWEQEVTARVIRPLHLDSTSVPTGTEITGPHAHGYEATADGWVDVTSADVSLQWSAAAIVSTADDLDRFFVALFQGRVVPAPELELMFTPPGVKVYDGDDDPTNDDEAADASYAIGLGRYQLGTVTVWGKSGDRPGYNSGWGATRDLGRRLAFSVNTLQMGGEQPEIAGRIIVAAFT